MLISRRLPLSLRALRAAVPVRCCCCCRSGSCSPRPSSTASRVAWALDDHPGGDQRVVAVAADGGDRRAAEHDLRDRLRARARPPRAAALAAVLDALIDLPFLVSPVIVGLALTLVYGDPRLVRHAGSPTTGSRSSTPRRDGAGHRSSCRCRSWFARWRRCSPRSATSRSRPRPRSARSGWQTFWRITLPSIRWGVAYGVILSTARALGEIGAVLVVSSLVAGHDPDPAPARLPARLAARLPGDHRRLRRRHRAGGHIAARAARHDRPRPQERRLQMSIDDQLHLQAVRRLHRARGRLPGGSRGLADRAARPQRLGQVNAAADHRRARDPGLGHGA